MKRKRHILITRRDFVKNLAIGTLISWSNLSLLVKVTHADESHEFEWRVPKAHYETIERELKYEGRITIDKNAKGLPLVYIFVGTVLLPYLAKAVIALRRQIIVGGVVIDTRNGKIDIQTDKGLSPKVILVVSDSDTVFYETNEIQNPSDLVQILEKIK